MNLYVTDAKLDIGLGSLDLVADDEIGIFDGNTCVGSAIVTRTITSTTTGMLAIVVSAQDSDWPLGTGFTNGNTISFHFWDASEEVETFGLTPIYILGDEVFSQLGSSYMSLSGRSCAYNGYPNASQTTCWDGSCADSRPECPAEFLSGCMTSTACNYNAAAVADDGSCVSATGCDTCSKATDGTPITDGTGIVVDGDINDNNICDVDETAGCMNDKACNYNVLAVFDDGSCATDCDTCASDGTLVPNGALDGVCDVCENGTLIDNDDDDDGICNLGIGDINSNFPTGFTITNIYPNPFNPSTTITYGIQENAHVKILIYNIVGEEITTLVNNYQAAGRHAVLWNADMQSGGMYLVKMITGKHVNTKKLMLIK